MKAIFEVKFKQSDMCDKESLKKEYGGSWKKCMKYLYEQEGLGIFSEELKLIDITE